MAKPIRLSRAASDLLRRRANREALRSRPPTWKHTASWPGWESWNRFPASCGDRKRFSGLPNSVGNGGRSFSAAVSPPRPCSEGFSGHSR